MTHVRARAARLPAALSALGVVLGVLAAAFATVAARAQEPRVAASGRTFDASGAPLPGVRVGARGTKDFVVTDKDGRFVLDLGALAAAANPSRRPAVILEFDKNGYLGQSVEIPEFNALAQPLAETLPPEVATESRAEFTARLSMSHAAAPLSSKNEGQLISAARWSAYFDALGRLKEAGLTQQTLFQAYAPKAAARLKAVFLMTRHGVGSIDQPQLRAFADRNAVALVAVKGDPVQRGFYPPDLLDPYLERLGEMLHRPELATLPAITFGHSNGTGFSALIAALRPDRTIAWISYHPGATSYLQYPDLEKTPGLVMHGLADPFFSPEHEAVIAALRRERAAPLTFMIEPDVPHFPVDKGQNATFAFIAAYCEAALRIRLKPDGGLRPVVLENGWLGGAYDRAKGGRQRLSIAPYRAFVGDPSTATWLPDETFAEVWRRYGETDPRSP